MRLTTRNLSTNLAWDLKLLKLFTEPKKARHVYWHISWVWQVGLVWVHESLATLPSHNSQNGKFDDEVTLCSMWVQEAHWDVSQNLKTMYMDIVYMHRKLTSSGEHQWPSTTPTQSLRYTKRSHYKLKSQYTSENPLYKADNLQQLILQYWLSSEQVYTSSIW
jgi:hypothetical protein